MREREREIAFALYASLLYDLYFVIMLMSLKENDTCIGVGISFSQPWEKIRSGLIARKGTHLWYIKTCVSNVGRMKSEDIKLVNNLTSMNLRCAKIFDIKYTHYMTLNDG